MIADIIFSLVLVVISIVWIIEGLRLGLWIPGVSAGSGFIPAVFALLALVSSLFVIASALKERKKTVHDGQPEEKEAEPEEKQKKPLLDRFATAVPVLFGIGGVVCLQLFGLVITVFAISFLWMLFVSRMKWKKVLVVSLAITLFIYLVFEFWLKIPFPGDIIKL